MNNTDFMIKFIERLPTDNDKKVYNNLNEEEFKRIDNKIKEVFN